MISFCFHRMELVLALALAIYGILHDAAAQHTLEEVATHGSNDDCWSAIYGQVYDLTAYAPQHTSRSASPSQVYSICGIDGTSLFNSVHSNEKEYLQFSSIQDLGPLVEATDPPTSAPVASPTLEPTSSPTSEPTTAPIDNPTSEPTSIPTTNPTEPNEPGTTPRPTTSPTLNPTSTPQRPMRQQILQSLRLQRVRLQDLQEVRL